MHFKHLTRRFLMNEKAYYLKWDDTVIGNIHSDFSVTFLLPYYNDVVSLYTSGHTHWTAGEFRHFLSHRIINRERRDIEKILFRCGLSTYDAIKIGLITRGIHPKDLLWIATDETEDFNAVISPVFESVFYQKFDLLGDSIDTPEGYNIKRYGVYNEKYGIYKQRISPLTTDVESEIAVYLLAKELGIPCCPAHRVDEKTIFSTFLYDFREEYLVHFRRLFEGERTSNEYLNLTSIRPQFTNSIIKMIVLDFITRQDDRHLSNIAIKITGDTESFYPLYDNGRSLFYEDTEAMVLAANKDPQNYATTFGYAGTYWDYVKEIVSDGHDITSLVNLDVSSVDIYNILVTAGFVGYRLEGAHTWIKTAIDLIKDLTSGN